MSSDKLKLFVQHYEYYRQFKSTCKLNIKYDSPPTIEEFNLADLKQLDKMSNTIKKNLESSSIKLRIHGISDPTFLKYMDLDFPLNSWIYHLYSSIVSRDHYKRTNLFRLVTYDENNKNKKTHPIDHRKWLCTMEIGNNYNVYPIFYLDQVTLSEKINQAFNGIKNKLNKIDFFYFYDYYGDYDKSQNIDHLKLRVALEYYTNYMLSPAKNQIKLEFENKNKYKNSKDFNGMATFKFKFCKPYVILFYEPQHLKLMWDAIKNNLIELPEVNGEKVYQNLHDENNLLELLACKKINEYEGYLGQKFLSDKNDGSVKKLYELYRNFLVKIEKEEFDELKNETEERLKQMEINCYSALNATRASTRNEIRKLYLKESGKLHPDKVTINFFSENKDIRQEVINIRNNMVKIIGWAYPTLYYESGAEGNRRGFYNYILDENPENHVNYWNIKNHDYKKCHSRYTKNPGSQYYWPRKFKRILTGDD